MLRELKSTKKEATTTYDGLRARRLRQLMTLALNRTHLPVVAKQLDEESLLCIITEKRYFDSNLPLTIQYLHRSNFNSESKIDSIFEDQRL